MDGKKIETSCTRANTVRRNDRKWHFWSDELISLTSIQGWSERNIRYEKNRKKKLWKIVIPITSFVSLLLVFIGFQGYRNYFSTPKAVSEKEHTYDIKEIYCSNNGKKIYGVAYIPNDMDGKLPTVIFSHGYNGTNKNNTRKAKSLAMSGIACYAYDFCGGSKSSKSDGKMIDMSVMTEKSDLMAVIDIVKTLDFVDSENVFLFGESQGGFVSAITAAEISDEIQGLMLLYPAFVISDDAREKYNNLDEVPDKISLMGGTIGKKYYEDTLEYDVYSVIGNYKKDVLIFHGDSDKIVNLSYSEKAVEVHESAELKTFKGQGHGFNADATDEVILMSYNYIINHLKK